MIKHLESLASAIFFFSFSLSLHIMVMAIRQKKNWRYLGEKQGTVNTSCKQNDRIFFLVLILYNFDINDTMAT